MLTWDDWGQAVTCIKCGRIVAPTVDQFDEGIVRYPVCCVSDSQPTTRFIAWVLKEFEGEEVQLRELAFINKHFKPLGKDDKCECGAHKLGHARGSPFHSSWCPWK